MAELMIGAGAAAGFLILLRYARTRALVISWWQWALTFLGFLYAVFVMEVVVSFFREGTPKGAAVMGTLLGFVAVVWAMVLGRTVFSGSQAPAVETRGKGGSHA
jgi:hypothetical protein